jgi:hypothetical protein
MLLTEATIIINYLKLMVYKRQLLLFLTPKPNQDVTLVLV